MRKIKEERQKCVRQMCEQKKSEKEIAEILGVSVSTVYADIRQLGLRNKNSAQLHKEILSLYASGKTLMEISFLLDVSKRYISAVVRKNGMSTHRNFAVVEKNLIDENTVFADNRIRLEKLMVDGKKYLDITQALSPR